jgi:UDP-glucose 4-epimerase
METVCWILGRGGLLGRSLTRATQDAGILEYVPQERFRWHEASACAEQLQSAFDSFVRASAGKHWQIIWAAGTGTMGSTEVDLAKETGVLATLIGLIGKEGSLTGRAGTVVYASSAGAIYSGCSDAIITEASLPHPENAYGNAKLAEEEMLKALIMQRPQISLLLARITNLYGPAQAYGKRQGLISHIARSILKRAPINIFVPFDTMRDYIPANDAAEMMIETAKTLQNGDILTKIVASEEPTTIAKIIGTFTAITRMPPRVITSASALSTSYPHRMCFRSVVGFRAEKKTPLLVGIAQVLAAERQALMQS